jgi:hypothetical protein
MALLFTSCGGDLSLESLMTDIRASQFSTTSNLGISARLDPAGLARQIANDSRVGGRIDVDLARAKADQLAAKNPELAASIRQKLESQMTPVERGQFAASSDTSSNGRLDQSRGTQIAGLPKKDESLERKIAKAYDNLSLTSKIQDLLVPQLGKLTKAAGLGKTEWGASLQKVLDTPGTAKAFREGINEGVINGGKEMVVGIAKLAGSAAQYGADKTLGGAGDALRGITGKMPGFLEAIVPSAKRGDASDAALGRLGNNIGNYVSSRSQNPNLLTSDVKNAINSAWGSLKADHAKAAAQGPQEEARWWGETIGRVTFEVAATVVPVAGAVGKADKARKTAAAASKADDLANAAKLANKIPDPWAGTPSGPVKAPKTPVTPTAPKAQPLLAPGVSIPTVAELSVGAALPDKGGLTLGGRALQKHGARAGSSFPNPKGSPASINAQAKAIVDGILNDPSAVTSARRHARFGDIIEVKLPDGRGLRFSPDSKLIGFLEAGK